MATTRSRTTGKQPMKEGELPPDDEAMVVNFTKTEKGNSSSALEGRVVVGKLLTNRALTRSGIRFNLTGMWEDYPEVQVAEITPSIFAFTFQEASHAKEVLEKRPWFVQNSLLSIHLWNPDIPHQEVRFELSPFWIQIHGLPLSLLNEDAIRKISERVGTILVIENPISNGKIIRTFARVKVEINTEKPIWAGSWISIDGDNRIWVNFKYERLQGLCFNCGVIGHEQKACKLPKIMASYDKSKPKFGPFLTTPTPRALAFLMNETMNSGVRGIQNQHIKAKEKTGCSAGMPGNVNEEEHFESHDSNDVGREEVGESEGGYHLRPRERNTRTPQHQKVRNTVESEVGGVFGGNRGQAAEEERLLGYVDLQDRVEDPHQLVLYTKNPNGQELIPVDLVEIDSEAGRWMEVGQEGLNREGGADSGNHGRIAYPVAQLQGLTQVQYSQSQKPEGNFYQIQLPEDSEEQVSNQIPVSLDKATEKELIWSWNDRLNLKRDRMLEAVEEELLRRKKQKREAWYDAEGRLLCVTQSNEFGTQTLVMNDKGQLRPRSP